MLAFQFGCLAEGGVKGSPGAACSGWGEGWYCPLSCQVSFSAQGMSPTSPSRPGARWGQGFVSSDPVVLLGTQSPWGHTQSTTKSAQTDLHPGFGTASGIYMALYQAPGWVHRKAVGLRGLHMAQESKENGKHMLGTHRYCRTK